MVSTAEAIVDAPTDSRAGEDEVIRQTEKQLLLIALGISVWRSEP